MYNAYSPSPAHPAGGRNMPYPYYPMDKDTFRQKVEFYPQIITDDFVLSWCNWGELDKYINKEMLDDTQKRIFEELIQSKDETNPILIKYQFK